ncbi:MAG: hypothetical protein PWQ68_600 [Thermoanaerobacteraceae bacterium]|jgi:TRAP-type C4-dicarboxylate transport system permease small subunit|nr:hypothetical protein [Thermoanaerobacteraceae bacterium]
MKNFFIKLDKVVYGLVGTLLGIVMVLLTLVINIQVLVRYVLNVSIGGFEETPVYLMMICVWIAAAYIARTDGHVKIEFIDMVIKNPRVLAGLKAALKGITTLVLAIFSVFAFNYVKSSFEMGEVTPGLQIPLWSLQAFVLFGSGFMTVYYLINTVKAVKEVIKWS